MAQLPLEKDFIRIYPNYPEGWLRVDWKGNLPYETVVEGLEDMIRVLESHPFRKVLNDTTQVSGSWSYALDYIEKEWNPRTARTQLEAIALVYSHDFFSQLSARHLPSLDLHFDLELFETLEEGQNWLRHKK